VNWITNYVRPRINSMLGRREVPENLWIKCPETGEMVFHKDLEENKWVIPASGYHMKMPAKARLADLFDGGQYESLPQPKVAQDPLKFRDSKKYADRLKDSRVKTDQEDTIVAGLGTVGVSVARLLDLQRDVLTARCGRSIVITAFSARDRTRVRGVDLSEVEWFADSVTLAQSPNIDVCVELIVGDNGPAK